MSVQFVTLPDGTVLVNATIPEGTSDAVEGGNVTILGTLVNSGEVEIVPGVTYNGTTDITSPGVLDFGSPVTELENTGLIAFYDAVFADTSGVSGQQTVIANDGTIEGSGTLALAGGKPLSINNTITGTIEANLNSTLTIDTNGGTLVNAGVITNASTYVYQYQYNAYVDVEGLGVTIADTKIINTGTINGAGYNESFLTAGADVVGGVLGSGNLYVSGSATLDGQSSSPVTLAFFDTLIVDNGGSLSLLGTIDLAGHLDDSSSGRNTDIVLATPTVTLTGTGEISLSDQIGNRIYGATGATTLINGVLIAGAGAIEANATGPLTIDNQAAGTIAATTANALVIDTAGAQLANAGLLLATGQGGLRLFSTPLYLLPSGTIEAAAGSLLFSDSSLANDVGGTLTGGTYMAGTYENSYSAVYPQDDTALPTGPAQSTGFGFGPCLETRSACYKPPAMTQFRYASIRPRLYLGQFAAFLLVTMTLTGCSRFLNSDPSPGVTAAQDLANPAPAETLYAQGIAQITAKLQVMDQLINDLNFRVNIFFYQVIENNKAGTNGNGKRYQHVV